MNIFKLLKQITDVCFCTLYYFSKFHRKVFIIVDNYCGPGETDKAHMVRI